MLVVPVPCLFDNFAYLIGCEETRECAVVDPSEYYPVSAAIEKNGFHLTKVLCTHHHQDHLDGLDDLLVEYPGVEIYGYETDRQRQPLMTNPVAEGDTVTIGKLQGKVFHTPGHTSGSCVFYFAGALFTGDTVFGAGCGRLFEGTAEQMFQSLKKIQQLCPPEAKMYPGHDYTLANLKFAIHLEPENRSIATRIREVEQNASLSRWQPSTIGLEQDTNPFFRCEEPSFTRTVKHLGSISASTPVELFAGIRRLKDNF